MLEEIVADYVGPHKVSCCSMVLPRFSSWFEICLCLLLALVCIPSDLVPVNGWFGQ